LAGSYDAKVDHFRLLYNDEHPDGNTSFTAGHTKGAVVFGDTKGFWLVHSVPKFPPVDDYGYPKSGHMYGQTFLCISLATAASADLIGTQLTYNRPYIYGAKMAAAFSKRYPILASAATGKHIKNPPFYNVVTIKSAAQQFTSFAKYSHFNKDLYADLVAPSLHAGLLVETWPNGKGRMNSSCSGPFWVENVKELDFKSIHPDIDFTTQHDHAKWAVSMDKNRPYVCVGDINRMESQKKRAGGTVCFADRKAWKQFGSLVKNFDSCQH
jgi:deoxyribonuclease-2